MVTRHRSTRSRRRRGAVVPLAVVALALGACGGDGGDAASEPTTRTEDVETAATPPPAGTTPTEEAPGDGVATIEPPLQLADTSWVVTNYTQSDGAMTNTLEDDTSLVLGGDGTLSGFNGCNEFAGTWEITGPYFDYDRFEQAAEDTFDGQPITITAEVTSDVECEGFLADQDADLMASLNGAEIWFIGNAVGDQEAGITLHGDDVRVYADPA